MLACMCVLMQQGLVSYRKGGNGVPSNEHACLCSFHAGP